MKYYPEIYFIDQHWSKFLDLISIQWKNGLYFLSIWAVFKKTLGGLSYTNDSRQNALLVLKRVRKRVMTCTCEEERKRDVMTLISSSTENEIKEQLHAAWKSMMENYYVSCTG